MACVSAAERAQCATILRVGIFQIHRGARVIRRKPDGTETDDPNEYADSWAEFAKPLEEFLGMKMSACDPDLRFTDYSDPKMWLTQSVPMWMARKMLDGIAHLKKQIVIYHTKWHEANCIKATHCPVCKPILEEIGTDFLGEIDK